ncbi:unnamed protein product [Paramecium sonneborni]|uniref:Uncharacterized protein n=1 Tax=Paramecium sonneborni TaxID=65129 RepID=A0A8S1LVB4_9CILI|nr:unnamed protein product [Paramecium sonneborni]
MSSYAYLFKFIIIGDSSVGKSCLLLQFLDRKFKLDHDTTIGVEFGSRTLNIRQKNIKLQIWDTAGQESFKSITRSYYRGSICAIIVYDVTSRDSFENISRWMEETKSYANDKITLVLVANKTDLSDKRVITTEEGQSFAKKHDLIFVEASAKTGFQVDKIFQEAAEAVLKKIEQRDIDATNESIGVRIGSQMTEEMIEKQKEQKASKCC